MKVVTVLAALLLLMTARTGQVRAQSTNLGCSLDQAVLPSGIFEANAQGLPKGLSTAQVVSRFAAAGITISWSPASSPVMIIDYAMDNGGQGAQVDRKLAAAGVRNLLKQADGNPVSFTLTFAHPVSSFTFTRAALYAGPSGVTNPPWNAVARAPDGTTIGTVSEDEIRSFSDVPRRRFDFLPEPRIASQLRPKIASMTFSGDDHKVDGQSNVVIDDLLWCP
jgi:hypothetical protein